MMISLLKRTLMMSTPLIFGSIGELIAERSGMMVTAIEGIFLFGAWAGFVGVYLTHQIVFGLLVAVASGMIAAVIYALICIYCRQNQIVTGTAINIIVAGLCTYFQRVLFGVPTTPLKIDVMQSVDIPLLSKIPLIGDIFFRQNILTYITYILVPCVFFVLYRTSIGLRLRSAGENPEAVETAGIDVRRVRFLAVLCSGAIGGLAGAFYSVAYLGMFSGNMIGGRGWIAFAICFLGNWTPLKIAASALIFGLAEALGIYAQTAGILHLPNELFVALPYILTIVLTVVRKNLSMPAELGKTYVKES